MNRELLTLLERSFKVIAEDFSKYSCAYVTTTDDGLKKSLHFLQRTYSLEIYTELLKKERLQKQHLDFLLNEYLKKLDVGILLRFLEKGEIIEKFSKIGFSLDEITNFDHGEQNCVDVFKAIVPCSPNVIKIDISGQCDDELLKLIAVSCYKLSELCISNSRAITRVGLLALALSPTKCPLKILHINDTSATANDIAMVLVNMPTLQDVVYDQLPYSLYFIHNEDIANNALEKTTKYNLISLDFRNYLISSMLVGFLPICSKLCPFVKKIVIPVTKSEELQLCCEFLELKHFSIYNPENYLFDSDLNSTSRNIDLNNFLSLRGSKLKTLSIDSCTLSMSILISNCPNLETLTLKDIYYQRVEKYTSESLPKLKSLQLWDIYLNQEIEEGFVCNESIVMLLGSSPNLECVSFIGSVYPHTEIIEKLTSIPLNRCIKDLNFERSDVDIEELKQIVLNCSALQSLEIKNCMCITSKEYNIIYEITTSSNKSIELSYISRSDFCIEIDEDDEDSD